MPLTGRRVKFMGDIYAYMAIESRVPADAGIVPFHPAVPLQHLPLLRDLDPFPRQRNQPPDHQKPVLRRRPTNASASGNIKSRNLPQRRLRADLKMTTSPPERSPSMVSESDEHWRREIILKKGVFWERWRVLKWTRYDWFITVDRKSDVQSLPVNSYYVKILVFFRGS